MLNQSPRMNTESTPRNPGQIKGNDETSALKKQIEELQKKLKDQEEKAAKDKKFFEEALDKRFEQMEEWEEKANEEQRKN